MQTIGVARLPAGPFPELDIRIGAVLFCRGEAVPFDLGDTPPDDAWFLGSVDDSLYLTLADDQVRRVADDGTLIPVGTPHETYGLPVEMSAATGHVFFPYNDRGTATTTITMMNARTGDVLDVLHPREDVSGLDRSDRRIIDRQRGMEPAGSVFARPSPDRRTGLHTPRFADARFVTLTTPLPKRPTDVIEVWSLGPQPTITHRLAFPVFGVGAVPPRPGRIPRHSVIGTWYEGPHSFIVEVVAPRRPGVAARSVLVRCNLAGACERAASSGKRSVSVIDAGSVEFVAVVT